MDLRAQPGRLLAPVGDPAGVIWRESSEYKRYAIRSLYEGQLPDQGCRVMYVLGSSLFVACLVLSADYGWASYRDWRTRRLRVKRGRTLTQKFSLQR